MGGHALTARQPDFAGGRAARAPRWARRTSSRPAAGRGRWRRPTWVRCLAGTTPDRLDEALRALARVPSTGRRSDAWVRRGARGRRAGRRPPPRRSASPPGTTATSRRNVFATAIAKYFRNATREAILLEVCDAGIVFLPGAGGTVQEVFQDACENYYADESSVAPMVLVGRDVLDRDRAGVAAAAVAGPGPGHGAARAPRRHARRGGRGPRGVTTRRRRAARRRRRSRVLGCPAPWSGCPSPRAGARTRARRPGPRRSTSSRAWG